MKNIFVFLLLFLPLCGNAQLLDADVLLGKAVDAMKADAPLQMDYSYTVYDEDNTVVMQDKGVMRLDGNRYSLLMDKMSVWCNGKAQWSYMLDIDEIYITDASSDEAQNLSPLHIMESYRSGCTKTAELRDGVAKVVMHTPQENYIESVVLSLDAVSFRLKAMEIVMAGQGFVSVVLDKYRTKCDFASAVYECPVEEFHTAEVVDMR